VTNATRPTLIKQSIWAGDFVYGQNNVGCNINIVAIQVLYGTQAIVCGIAIFVSTMYLLKIRRYPETLLGPTSISYAITSFIFAVARVLDPIVRTIGNDPLVTTMYGLSCISLFALDHALVILYVDETANNVYRETSLDLDNLAGRLRQNYLPKSLFASIAMSSVPTLCMLASTSPVVMEALTGLQWLLYAVMGFCVLVLLLIFMGAAIRAFDGAISAARLSPANLQIIPKLERTRWSIARTRFIVCAVLCFDLCVCFIVAPWPAAQANLSYLVPYVWIINTLAIFRVQYMYAKPQLAWLFGMRSAESSNASPSLSNPPTSNNRPTYDANIISLEVVGGSMSTVVDGAGQEAREEDTETRSARHQIVAT